MLHGYLSRVYADLVSPPLSADMTVGMGGGRIPLSPETNPGVVLLVLTVPIHSRSSGEENDDDDNNNNN